MTNLDILCFNRFNLKNKIIKIEHKKIFRGPLKILKNICLKYFMASTKTLHSPRSYILNVWSLKWFLSFLMLQKRSINADYQKRLLRLKPTSKQEQLKELERACLK